MVNAIALIFGLGCTFVGLGVVSAVFRYTYDQIRERAANRRQVERELNRRKKIQSGRDNLWQQYIRMLIG